MVLKATQVLQENLDSQAAQESPADQEKMVYQDMVLRYSIRIH